MYNPFGDKPRTDIDDDLLVARAAGGDMQSLEELIGRHQSWIYNIVLRMVYDPVDAEDCTQEILIKIMTNLAGFAGRSAFRTWAYRIACNHVLNMKKSMREKGRFSSFDGYWEGIENTPDADFPVDRRYSVDDEILVDEVRQECMMGMLVCLDREQRLVFILGALFKIKDVVACEILSISRANFRQKLSRARKQIFNFMNEKCGLINPQNPCLCKRKVKGMIAHGAIDPDKLRFSATYLAALRDIAPGRVRTLSSLFEGKVMRLFREQPFLEGPDFVDSLREILRGREISAIITHPGTTH
ncbi:MAG TPA: RNA polymerase sigma factor [Spirochaetota bacterium]